MQIEITKLTDLSVARKAAEATMHGQDSKLTVEQLAKCEHSPLRCLTYLIELVNIPSFVSVHLTRHKVGVEHFVKSMRIDNWADEVANRNTPVNHTMFINAQALLTMARKRLCSKASIETQTVMKAIRESVHKVEPELANFLVPECCYRNGYCPELKPCHRNGGNT